MRNVLLVGLMLGFASSALLAHTGPLVNGEPPDEDIIISSAAPLSVLHDESIDNPMEAYKGWWWFTLTNNTGFDWTGVNIKAGENDLVALVQGNNLPDEWGFTNNSVVMNRAGSIAYSGYLGDRTYENGAYGLLWREADATFTSPVLNGGGKVSFKVYTDNSWYQGEPATVFSLTITPIPEPASLLLLGIGGLALIRRR